MVFKELVRKSIEFYDGIKGKLKIFFDLIFDDWPKKPINLPSLRKIGSEFGVARNFVKDYLLNEYLPIRFVGKYKEVFNQYWPISRPDDTFDKYNKLIKLFNSQLKRYYPNDIDRIDSIGKLSKQYNVGFISVKAWIMKYLNESYDSDIAQNIYQTIFPTLSSKSPSFNDIKKFIEKRRGKLITDEIEWHNMKEQPTKRYIRVECKKNHLWTPIVAGLIYDNRWCPSCNEGKCEELTRRYMEAIFSAATGTTVRFPTTTFRQAFGIGVNQGGRMHFDGFNSSVRVKGKIFRVAFEYDGIQHDEFPNNIHRNKLDFEALQERDKKKNEIVQKPEYRTVIVRLKEKLGFNYDNHDLFQREIIRQFQENTGLKLPPIPIFVFDRLANTLNQMNNLKDEFI